MRLTVRFWECLCLALAVASLPDVTLAAADDAANVAAQYHCAGSAQLTANTNLTILNKVRALPSAAAVRKLALRRISGLLARNFQFGTNASTASLIEPLLSDVLETESLGSFGGSTTNFLSFVLALRLDTNRAQSWHDDLGKIFGGAGEKFTTEEFNGWRWKRGASDSFWIMPAREWLLVGRGDDLLPMQAEYLRQVSRQGRPGPALTDHWLEADLDCARLNWRLLQPARVKLNIATESNNLHMAARLIYPEAIPWKSSPWRTPAELVSSPLTSFTAGQNIAAVFNLGPNFSRLEENPFTNQFYIWAQDGMPLLTYMAWPVMNATNALEKLSTNAPVVFNPELKQFNDTELIWAANRRKLVLSNLRVVTPFLEAVPGDAGDFLLASVFPRARTAQPPAPDDLWKQFNGRTNLVYYDWELTGPRLQQWRLLGRMLLTRSHGLTNTVMGARMLEEKLQGDLTPLAGKASTVTEITRVAPNELSVVRNSPVGFTGIEMFLLSEWLSNLAPPPLNSPPPAH
jgi:hypothetical protein